METTTPTGLGLVDRTDGADIHHWKKLSNLRLRAKEKSYAEAVDFLLRNKTARNQIMPFGKLKREIAHQDLHTLVQPFRPRSGGTSIDAGVMIGDRVINSDRFVQHRPVAEVEGSGAPVQALVIRRSIAVVLLLLVLVTRVHGYSVLSHEALIDAGWETSIRPLLLKRFPNATPNELHRAHGFAYGGAIIQDLGYYPHGSHFFSDLVHYVRSSDFIQALIRDSQDIDEYAFALGALAHYAADNNGHRIAVNRSVPILYPGLQKKYGDVATYEDDPGAHLKTEFGFDVLEVAKERYAPDSYHDFVGFEVSENLLERAFQETYSMTLGSLFGDLDDAIGSYRYSVHTVIPKATKVAWVLKKKDIQRDLPGTTQRKFLYNLSKASYEKEWGTKYQRPGFGTNFLAFIIQLIPKIGPLKTLSFRTPTPETEKMFMASFNVALEEYRRLLADIGAGRLDLPNLNLDTGSMIQPGTYFMQDEAYVRLLANLEREQFKQISPALRSDILAYFGGLRLPTHSKRDKMEKIRVDWNKVPQEVDELRALPSDSSPQKSRTHTLPGK